MEERRRRFAVGVMVLAAILVTVILVVMFGETPSMLHSNYQLEIVFKQAPGVTRDTPVRKSGILIGRVTDVQFAKDEHGRETTDVVVTVSLQGDKHVYEDEFCRVQTSLLGDAALEFVRVPPEKRALNVRPTSTSNPPPASDQGAQMVAPGSRIHGQYAPDPAQMAGDLQNNLQSTIGAVTQTSEQLSIAAAKFASTLDRVNSIIDQNRESLGHAMQESGSTLQEIRETSATVRQFIGDPELQKDLKESIKRFPQLIEDTQSTVRTIQGMVGSMDRNLRNVEQITSAVSENNLGARLDQSLSNLDRLLSNLAAFSEEMRNPNGSLNRLVSDPELYQNLNRAAKNVDELTRELKPVLDDARVFTDKVSRHPGVIVRDALHPQPGIK